MATPIQRPVSTFSIVALDPQTGEVGIAVQSKFLASGSVVPWARAGAGAIAVQSWSNTSYAEPALKMMAEGMHPEEIMKVLTKDDDMRALRQVGIVDCQGRSVTYTGNKCMDWAGGVCGQNFAAQGNILVSQATVDAMAETFNSATGDLAERLSLALAAGQKAGGDRRGMQSAGLYIAKAGGGYGGFNDRYVDIRVDDHPDPINELRRILVLWRLLFFKTKKGNIKEITGEVKDCILNILAKEGFYKGQHGAWDPEMQKAFTAFCHTNNFEERDAPTGQIDGEVLDYLQSVYK
ncbi:MAG: DUF1028 domain-containing protein [Treponema sp.]|jgi:uncharacterized Ntn-hydrolase superfamily protein|nr:DUF1028 domain-containing protein [Treponema sp.]